MWPRPEKPPQYTRLSDFILIFILFYFFYFLCEYCPYLSCVYLEYDLL